jgi:vitamin B12 transporter
MSSALPSALLAAAVLSAAPAFAQTATEVAPLVVSPTLTPTPQNEIGSSVTLITAEVIDAHQWRTLPDALAAQPGLNLVQEGGPGGLASVFIRGANSNHTEVVIDGIDVNDPSQNGAFDFGQSLAAGLASIEVLRGPQSSLYGADALGGVIALTTAPGEGPARLTASLEGGSFATFNQNAILAGSAGRFHYDLQLAHFHSGDTPVTPPSLLGSGERALGDGYDNVTASAKLGYDLTAHAGLGLVARAVDTHYRSTGENFDVFPAIPDSVQTRQFERQVFVRLTARDDVFEGRLRSVLGAAYANFHTRIQSPDDGFGLPAPVFDDGDRLKFDWLGTIGLARSATLVLGVDETVDRLIDSPVSAIDTRTGGLGELQIGPATGLSLAASARYDADSRFGDKATWRLAGAYTVLATATLLRASVGTGFKAPTLTELFVSFPAFDFFANPHLRPETSTGYDLGFEQPFAHGTARLGATWFHNAIANLIETDPTGTTWANIGRATAYGVESFAAVRLSRRLDLRADYTWTIARDDIAREELLRRPKDKASLTAAWRPAARLRLTGAIVYVGSWIDGNRDFSIERERASPFATVNIAGDYDLGRGVILFARVDNLLDRRYQEPIGFDKPGIGGYAGVRLSLRGR